MKRIARRARQILKKSRIIGEFDDVVIIENDKIYIELRYEGDYWINTYRGRNFYGSYIKDERKIYRIIKFYG